MPALQTSPITCSNFRAEGWDVSVTINTSTVNNVVISQYIDRQKLADLNGRYPACDIFNVPFALVEILHALRATALTRAQLLNGSQDALIASTLNVLVLRSP